MTKILFSISLKAMHSSRKVWMLVALSWFIGKLESVASEMRTALLINHIFQHDGQVEVSNDNLCILNESRPH